MYSTNILPKITNTIINGNVEFYKNSNVLFNTFKDVLGALQYNLDIEKAKTSTNTIEDLTELYKKLNDNNFILESTLFETKLIESVNIPGNPDGLEESPITDERIELPDIGLSFNFINHYVEMYQNLSDTFKLYILKKLDGEENHIYKNFSEDIGLVLDMGTKLNFNNVEMDNFYYDKLPGTSTENHEEGPPTNLPANVITKVSENVFRTTQTMNLRTDGMLRSNLLGITVPDGTSPANLNPDTEFRLNVFDDLKKIKTSKINTKFGEKLGKIISFYKNLNVRNQEKYTAPYTQYLTNVEEVSNFLDIFNNNIHTTAIVDQTVVS